MRVVAALVCLAMSEVVVVVDQGDSLTRKHGITTVLRIASLSVVVMTDRQASEGGAGL